MLIHNGMHLTLVVPCAAALYYFTLLKVPSVYPALKNHHGYLEARKGPLRTYQGLLERADTCWHVCRSLDWLHGAFPAGSKLWVALAAAVGDARKAILGKLSTLV